MAAEEGDHNLAQFEALFAAPTLDGMLGLTWQEFEFFVAHVFRCAGYGVQHVGRDLFPGGPGVDLNLFTGPIRGKPFARVEVRRYKPDHKLYLEDVRKFVGTLTIAGGVPGYLVTTSTFHDYATLAAEAIKDKVRLIDGNRLRRYITYVGGSRLNGSFGGMPVAPVQPTSPAWLWTADELVTATGQPPQRTRVLAIANTKGGVAKTTTAQNVGFALAEQYKQRVLLVDMDGQASLTRSFPRPLPADTPRAEARTAPPPPDTRFLADYFRSGAPLSKLVRSTRFANLSLLPARRELYLLQFAGAERAKAELRLVEDLRRLIPEPEHDGEKARPFDWIILDTPAGDSFYGRAALAAADYIVIPAFTETFGVQGVGEVIALSDTMGALMGDVNTARQRILGCLVTRWKKSRPADEAYAQLVLALSSRGIPLFNTKIPLDDRIETAHQSVSVGGLRSIFRLANQLGPAATAYDSFVKELVEHVHQREATH